VDGVAWNYELQAVYLIALLGFEYDKNEEKRKLERNVQLKDQDGDLFYDKLEMIFLQMPIFTKTESELETQKDKWYYFLKNLSGLEQIPAILREPVFEQAFATAELARLSRDELLMYEASLKIYRDNYSAYKTARIEGKAEGRAEGETQKALEIAQSMKKDGIDPAIIAKHTGLTLDEVKRLE
jgi:predicted transposase/invertase (TIGR01784 family)